MVDTRYDKLISANELNEYHKKASAAYKEQFVDEADFDGALEEYLDENLDEKLDGYLDENLGDKLGASFGFASELDITNIIGGSYTPSE